MGTLRGQVRGQGFDESFPCSHRLLASFVQGTPLLHSLPYDQKGV